VEIRGSKVVLRDWKEKDLSLFRFAFTTATEWLRLDAPYLAVPTGDDLEALIEKKRAMIQAKKPVPRSELVVAELSSDDLVGRVTRYWQSEETRWLSVGIDIFFETRWGAGLGQQALGLWCEYLFGAMPSLARLDLRTWEGNERMARLARRLGFQEEARFRKARVVDGRYFDALGFGVLREEWKARFPDGFQRLPNQSVDSTPSAGTPAAEQPRGPAPVADHL
jgi:putative hydrolase of HD superfamily